MKCKEKSQLSSRPIPGFLLIVLILLLTGCEKSATQKAPEQAAKREEIKQEGISLKETRFAAIPEDYERWDNITFSADGRQVFYKAIRKGREFMVSASAGGQSTGREYEVVSWLVTDRGRRKFAFGGKKGGKKRLIVDNREMKDFSYEDIAPDAFSPDGRLVSCEVEDREKKEWFISVSDGKKELYRSPGYPDAFRQSVFSPDGRLLVYELGEDKKRIIFFLDLSTWKIIKEKRLCAGCIAGKFSFSSGSSRIIYEVNKEEKHFLVLYDARKDERTIELPRIAPKGFFLSPDGERIVYIATTRGKHYVVISSWESPLQGIKVGPYEGFIAPVFSADSTIVAYQAMKKGKWRIVVGGKEGAKYDAFGDGIVLSSRGAKIAYAANKGGHQNRMGLIDGKWIMVVSRAAKPLLVKEGPAYDVVVTPVFSPDGKYIAYRARTGPMENARRFIVIADAETGKVIKEGSVGDEIWPPVWSADGKSVGYGARIGRELWWQVETVE